MELVKNCHVPNFDGLHNIYFIGNRADISVNELYKIARHWQQNVENICGKECKRTEKYCIPHRQCDHNICMNNWCFNILKKKLQWKFSKDSYQTVFL